MTADEAALVTRSAAPLGVLVDTGVLERIDHHLDVLDRWNGVTRLTAERDRRTIIERHVIDSLAAARWVSTTGMAVDVGSGAGFPGIVVACVKPDAEMVLIESRRRRASFLGDAIRSIPLPRVRVIARRAEDVAGEELRAVARTAMTRAVRPEAFLPLAAMLLAPGGTAIVMQTRDGANAAVSTAAAYGFRLDEQLDYVLPDSRRRTIVALRRD